ncbi:unnamed protein product, partial [Prunus brigantina]
MTSDDIHFGLLVVLTSNGTLLLLLLIASLVRLLVAPKPTIYRKSSCQQKRCDICFEDFVNGDCCRVVPSCNHTFHLTCTDLWLTSPSFHAPFVVRIMNAVYMACA